MRTTEGQALLNLAAADADWYRLIYHRVPLIEAEARAEGYAAGLAAVRRVVALIPCLMHVPPGRCLDVDMAPPSWSPCANCQALAAIDALSVTIG